MVLYRREATDGPDWEERVYRGDETIVSELLPGFAGTVAELWADAELDDSRNGPHEGHDGTRIQIGPADHGRR